VEFAESSPCPSGGRCPQRAIAEGDTDVGPLITGEVGLDGVGAAFDALAKPDTHCKILVTP
jgi:threonine dehydrogenase-like Zn-dependent dehydrogenase